MRKMFITLAATSALALGACQSPAADKVEDQAEAQADAIGIEHGNQLAPITQALGRVGDPEPAHLVEQYRAVVDGLMPRHEVCCCCCISARGRGERL